MRAVPINTIKTRNRLPSFLVILCLILYSFVISYTEAKPAQDIAKEAFPSVAMLVMQDSHGQPTSLGSGFFVKEDMVATNLHVIEGAVSGYTKIVGKKPKYDIAGFVTIDQQRDLVLLKVQGVKAPTLVLADSNDVAVGDEVYAIGNPQGLEGTFSKGIISSIRKIGKDSLLQITAPISPGSSGGPVLDNEGKVVGVSVATFKGGQNLNFAIPSSYLRPLLSNSNSVTPFSPIEKLSKKQSILETFGGKNTEGVVGKQLIWEYKAMQSGKYSFSLQNKLQQPVKNIWCLVIFYNDRSEPIDVDLVHSKKEIVLPGLAKRVKSSVDGSVQELTTREGRASPHTKVEFRILDFQILQSEDIF